MPADSFKPKQKIRVSYRAAAGPPGVFDGEIIEHVKDDVWRVTFGGFGLRFLIPEKDLQDAEERTSNEKVVADQASVKDSGQAG